MLLILLVGGMGSLAYSLNDEVTQMIETLPQARQKFHPTLDREWGDSEGAINNVQQAAVQFEHAASENSAILPTVSKGVTRVLIEEPRFNVRDYLLDGTISALSLISLA